MKQRREMPHFPPCCGLATLSFLSFKLNSLLGSVHAISSARNAFLICFDRASSFSATN